MVFVDGFECGGYFGEDDIFNMILLFCVVEELDIFFLVLGGMVDVCFLVVLFVMGVEGMNMGMCFMVI